MAKKNTADVLIGGKVYTISGYESTAYLQKVAAYLNEIEEQVSGMEGVPPFKFGGEAAFEEYESGRRLF